LDILMPVKSGMDVLREVRSDDRLSRIPIIVMTAEKKAEIESLELGAIDFIPKPYPELGVIREGQYLQYIPEPLPTQPPVFTTELDDRVFVLKLIPGMDASVFAWLREHYDALVIESFGVGGVPCEGDEGFISAIEDWVASGKVIVMTTQVPHEGSDMEVYQVGYQVKNRFGILEAYDMTLEAIVTKLMWILGQTRDPDRVRALFYQPVQHDQIR